MRKIGLLFLCFSLFCTTSVAKDTTQLVKYLVVWEKTGSSVAFPLVEKPCLTFDVPNSQIHCVTPRQSVHFSLEQVCKYTLEATTATGVQPVTDHNEKFSINNSSLIFDKYPAKAKILIYTNAGKLFQTYQVDDDGRLCIPIQKWPGGTYMIKTESVTYKMMKK